ncbi:MAG: hypothetical protein ACI9DF_000519 [Verrucomicrobiales bacterium]|jgi:hypothetical protein
MEDSSSPFVRQQVDWGAAIRAAFIGGATFLLLIQVFQPGFSPEMMVRYFASILLGNEILAASPDNPLTWRAYLGMGLFHFAVAFAFTAVVAFVVHHRGILLSMLVGGILGLCLYGINTYTITKFVPHFFILESGFFLATHVIFGALVGAIYEALEFEVFVDASGNVINLENPDVA